MREMIFIRKWFLALCLVAISISCSDSNDPEPQPDRGNLVEATHAGSWAAVQLKLFIQLSGRDIDAELFDFDVDVYRVVYKTTYQDDEIEASGLIILPKTTTEVPMISFQHGTIVEQSDAPSVQDTESEQVISYAALASMGFITVVPDMLGFGESQDIFHPYYIEEPTANAVTDMLLAARTLAAEKQVEFDEQLFLAGYSQGGYATLAAHKALENDPLEGFTLVASFPGAGGYDITEMLNHFRGLDSYDDPFYVAYIGMSYQSYYEAADLLEGFFNQPYASRIPTLFDGIKTGAQINAQLTNDISDLISGDILSDPESSPLYDFLFGSFSDNSLVDWTPVAPVFLYHGDADTTVPLNNSQVTYEKLLDNGADPDKLKLFILPGYDHDTAVEPYIEDVVKRLQELK